MKKQDDVFIYALKILVGFLWLPMLFVGLYALPLVIITSSGLDVIEWILIVLLYLVFIPYGMVLIHAFHLLAYYGHTYEIKQELMTSYEKLRKWLAYLSALMIACLPFLYIIVDRDDSPGLLLFGIILTAMAITFYLIVSLLRRMNGYYFNQAKTDDER